MTLRLVYSKSGGRGGKPPPPPTPPHSSGHGRPNWLANLLWYAISRAYFEDRAITVREIAERMTKLSRQILGRHVNVTERQAAHVLGVVRNKPLGYGYTVAHVEKGVGKTDEDGDDISNRAYIPIQIDYDERLGRYALIDDEELVYIKAGAVSSAKTVATMLRNEASATELAAEVFPNEWGTVPEEWRRMATRADTLARHARLL